MTRLGENKMVLRIPVGDVSPQVSSYVYPTQQVQQEGNDEHNQIMAQLAQTKFSGRDFDELSDAEKNTYYQMTRKNLGLGDYETGLGAAAERGFKQFGANIAEAYGQATGSEGAKEWAQEQRQEMAETPFVGSRHFVDQMAEGVSGGIPEMAGWAGAIAAAPATGGASLAGMAAVSGATGYGEHIGEQRDKFGDANLNHVDAMYYGGTKALVDTAFAYAPVKIGGRLATLAPKNKGYNIVARQGMNVIGQAGTDAVGAAVSQMNYNVSRGMDPLEGIDEAALMGGLTSGLFTTAGSYGDVKQIKRQLPGGDVFTADTVRADLEAANREAVAQGNAPIYTPEQINQVVNETVAFQTAQKEKADAAGKRARFKFPSIGTSGDKNLLADAQSAVKETSDYISNLDKTIREKAELGEDVSAEKEFQGFYDLDSVAYDPNKAQAMNIALAKSAINELDLELSPFTGEKVGLTSDLGKKAAQVGERLKSPISDFTELAMGSKKNNFDKLVNAFKGIYEDAGVKVSKAEEDSIINMMTSGKLDKNIAERFRAKDASGKPVGEVDPLTMGRLEKLIRVAELTNEDWSVPTLGAGATGKVAGGVKKATDKLREGPSAAMAGLVGAGMIASPVTTIAIGATQAGVGAGLRRWQRDSLKKTLDEIDTSDLDVYLDDVFQRVGTERAAASKGAEEKKQYQRVINEEYTNTKADFRELVHNERQANLNKTPSERQIKATPEELEAMATRIDNVLKNISKAMKLLGDETGAMTDAKVRSQFISKRIELERAKNYISNLGKGILSDDVRSFKNGFDKFEGQMTKTNGLETTMSKYKKGGGKTVSSADAQALLDGFWGSENSDGTRQPDGLVHLISKLREEDGKAYIINEDGTTGEAIPNALYNKVKDRTKWFHTKAADNGITLGAMPVEVREFGGPAAEAETGNVQRPASITQGDTTGLGGTQKPSEAVSEVSEPTTPVEETPAQTEAQSPEQVAEIEAEDALIGEAIAEAKTETPKTVADLKKEEQAALRKARVEAERKSREEARKAEEQQAEIEAEDALIQEAITKTEERVAADEVARTSKVEEKPEEAAVENGKLISVSKNQQKVINGIEGLKELVPTLKGKKRGEIIPEGTQKKINQNLDKLKHILTNWGKLGVRRTKEEYKIQKKGDPKAGRKRFAVPSIIDVKPDVNGNMVMSLNSQGRPMFMKDPVDVVIGITKALEKDFAGSINVGDLVKLFNKELPEGLRFEDFGLIDKAADAQFKADVESLGSKKFNDVDQLELERLEKTQQASREFLTIDPLTGRGLSKRDQGGIAQQSQASRFSDYSLSTEAERNANIEYLLGEGFSMDEIRRMTTQEIKSTAKRVERELAEEAEVSTRAAYEGVSADDLANMSNEELDAFLAQGESEDMPYREGENLFEDIGDDSFDSYEDTIQEDVANGEVDAIDAENFAATVDTMRDELNSMAGVYQSGMEAYYNNDIDGITGAMEDLSELAQSYTFGDPSVLSEIASYNMALAGKRSELKAKQESGTLSPKVDTTIPQTEIKSALAGKDTRGLKMKLEDDLSEYLSKLESKPDSKVVADYWKTLMEKVKNDDFTLEEIQTMMEVIGSNDTNKRTKSGAQTNSSLIKAMRTMYKYLGTINNHVGGDLPVFLPKGFYNDRKGVSKDKQKSLAHLWVSNAPTKYTTKMKKGAFELEQSNPSFREQRVFKDVDLRTEGNFNDLMDYVYDLMVEGSSMYGKDYFVKGSGEDTQLTRWERTNLKDKLKHNVDEAVKQIKARKVQMDILKQGAREANMSVDAFIEKTLSKEAANKLKNEVFSKGLRDQISKTNKLEDLAGTNIVKWLDQLAVELDTSTIPFGRVGAQPLTNIKAVNLKGKKQERREARFVGDKVMIPVVKKGLNGQEYIQNTYIYPEGTKVHLAQLADQYNLSAPYSSIAQKWSKPSKVGKATDEQTQRASNKVRQLIAKGINPEVLPKLNPKTQNTAPSVIWIPDAKDPSGWGGHFGNVHVSRTEIEDNKRTPLPERATFTLGEKTKQKTFETSGNKAVGKVEGASAGKREMPIPMGALSKPSDANYKTAMNSIMEDYKADMKAMDANPAKVRAAADKAYARLLKKDTAKPASYNRAIVDYQNDLVAQYKKDGMNSDDANELAQIMTTELISNIQGGLVTSRPELAEERGMTQKYKGQMSGAFSPELGRHMTPDELSTAYVRKGEGQSIVGGDDLIYGYRSAEDKLSKADKDVRRTSEGVDVAPAIRAGFKVSPKSSVGGGKGAPLSKAANKRETSMREQETPAALTGLRGDTKSQAAAYSKEKQEQANLGASVGRVAARGILDTGTDKSRTVSNFWNNKLKSQLKEYIDGKNLGATASKSIITQMDSLRDKAIDKAVKEQSLSKEAAIKFVDKKLNNKTLQSMMDVLAEQWSAKRK